MVYYSKLDERSGNYEEVETLRADSTEVDLEQLELQSTYKITVTALNSVGEGEHSEELTIQTQRSVAPSQPREVQAEIKDG